MYTPTTWVFNTTLGTFTRMNNLETQYTQATTSFNRDLFTAFVLSGLVATKDGVTVNQLDVTSGVAYILQSDSTLFRIAPVSSTQVTSAATSTYHLYLQPDGTWYWNTANTPQANSLFIAQVTTDGSGNISTVTDERTLTTTLFNGQLGFVKLSQLYSDAGNITSDGSGDLTVVGNATIGGTINSSAGTLELVSKQSGAASGVEFKAWSSSAGVVVLSVGGHFGSALSWVDISGNFNGPVSCGVPMTRLISSTWTAISVPIYSGASAPTATQAPPTGSLFIEA